jgi:hypothetical protein
MFILIVEVLEPISVCLSIVPQRGESVVEVGGFCCESEQLLLARVVDDLRWSDLPVVTIDDNRCSLVFDTEIDRQDMVFTGFSVLLSYLHWYVKRIAVFRFVERRRTHRPVFEHIDKP